MIGAALMGCLGMVGVMGCLAYRAGGDLPHRTVESQGHRGKPASVFIETRCQSRNILQNNSFEDVNKAQYLRFIVSSVISTNRDISHYTFSANRATQMEYRVVLSLSTEEKGSFAGAVLSGMTLAIIPGTWKMQYRLQVELFDATGYRVQENRVESSMRVWVQLLLFPLGSFKSPEKAEQKILGDMVKTAFDKLSWPENERRNSADPLFGNNTKESGHPVSDTGKGVGK